MLTPGEYEAESSLGIRGGSVPEPTVDTTKLCGCSSPSRLSVSAVPHPRIQPTADPVVLRLSIEKNPRRSGPGQFKPVLFRGSTITGSTVDTCCAPGLKLSAELPCLPSFYNLCMSPWFWEVGVRDPHYTDDTTAAQRSHLGKSVVRWGQPRAACLYSALFQLSPVSLGALSTCRC